MVRKTLFILLLIFTNKLLHSQTTKLFTGAFYNTFTYGNDGSVSYHYYEDEQTRNFVKHGEFKYTFEGEGNYKGLVQTITGNFHKGLKNGLWIYKISLTDVGPDNYGSYASVNIILTANYINGYANGNWKEIGESKKRKYKNLNGQKIWDEYTNSTKIELNFNFSKGNLVGDFYINDLDEGSLKANGKIDNLGFGEGIWNISDIRNGEEGQIIYKNKFITEIISRNSSGEINNNSRNKEQDYKEYLIAKELSVADREEKGLFIDTISGYDESSVARLVLKKYIDKIFEEWFLYDKIKGDLSYENMYSSIPKEIRLTKIIYDKLEENQSYLNGDKNLEKKEYIKAFKNYYNVDTSNLSPSEKKKFNIKIQNLNLSIDSILKIQNIDKKNNESIIKSLNDSVKLNFNSCQEKILTGEKKISELKNKKQKIEEDFKTIEQFEIVNEKLVNIINEKFKNHQNFLDDIQNEIYNSKSRIKFNNEYIDIYDIDFKKIDYKINNSVLKIDSSIKAIELIFNIYKKINEIEQLNIDNEKKVVFKKYKIIINEFKNKLITSDVYKIQNSLTSLKNLSLCFDNIIYLYSDKFKTIEKELKELENTNEIINYLIKIK